MRVSSPISFAVQSALRSAWRPGARRSARPSLTASRARRCASAYSGVLALALLFALVSGGERTSAFALGVAAPGAGFLPWAAGDGWVAVGLALGSGALFAASLVLWFGTGNVVLPPLVWLASAVAAALARDLGLVDAGPAAAHWPVAALLFALLAPAVALRRRGGGSGPKRADTVAAMALWGGTPAAARDAADEIDLSTLRLQRLLLDRALQPIGEFKGFEWRDQFQTAAVRYQLNFISYALSVAQARHLPAFGGCVLEAQRRLLAKLCDRRMWRYWALENAWGHLRLGADPVPRGNIMFTGFAAAQIAFAEAASGRSIARRDGRHLRLERPSGAAFEYALPDLAALLAAQYRRSPWGLLACEPHWIYPLCNFITACAVRAADAQHGSDHWSAIRDGFRDGLEREFTTRDGRIVPFRSSLTGLALPFAGGAVMQAFPCLFLHALFPDLARRRWGRVRVDLAGRSWKRAFWPIDVGNYGFSRASSLAASAAAAVEMGDGESAAAMLDLLDEECPAATIDGVTHRPRASLWAHALELAARCGGAGTVAALASTLPVRGEAGPCLEEAPYPDVLVARAVRRGGRLELVLHPGRSPCVRPILLGGLDPGREYRALGASQGRFRAGRDGTARLEVALLGRHELAVSPVA